jgi:hypothetical protein
VEHLEGPERLPLTDGGCIFIGHDGDGATAVRVIGADGTLYTVFHLINYRDLYRPGQHEGKVLAQFRGRGHLPSIAELYLADARVLRVRVATTDPRHITARFFGDAGVPNAVLVELWMHCVESVVGKLLQQVPGVTSIVMGGDMLSRLLRQEQHKLPGLRRRLAAHGPSVWATLPRAALSGTLSHRPLTKLEVTSRG